MTELLIKLNRENISLLFEKINESDGLVREFFYSYYINGIKISDIQYDGKGGYYIPLRSLEEREDDLEFEEIVMDRGVDDRLDAEFNF